MPFHRCDYCGRDFKRLAFHHRFCAHKKQHDKQVFDAQLEGARRDYPLVMQAYDRMEEQVEEWRPSFGTPPLSSEDDI